MRLRDVPDGNSAFVSRVCYGTLGFSTMERAVTGDQGIETKVR